MHTHESNPLPVSNRIDALLALRGMACLIVVVHHLNVPRSSILFHNQDWSWLMFAPGGVAVWIFFCLSGYLMGKGFSSGRYALTGQGVLNFWRNRALRILPLYYFCILIVSIFVHPEIFKIENWGFLLKILTFTYGWTESTISFNAPLWSLSPEVQFYLLVPFLYALVGGQKSRFSRLIAGGCLIIGSAIVIKAIFWIALNSQIRGSVTAYFQYICSPVFAQLDVFGLGLLTNALMRSAESKLQDAPEPPSRRRWLEVLHRFRKPIAIALLIVLYLASAHHQYYQELMNLPTRIGMGARTDAAIFVIPIITGLVTSFFIYAFEAKSDRGRIEKLSFDAILRHPIRALEVLGVLSYGIYIWHIPIFHRIMPHFIAATPLETFFRQLYAVVILSIVLSTVTYYLVELPAANLKRYRFNVSPNSEERHERHQQLSI